jgi:hypothetical protein
MKLNVKLLGFASFFAILMLLVHGNQVGSQSSKNLVLDYTITIDDPASHIVRVELTIDNNRPYDEIVLVRAGAETLAPVSNLSVKNGQGEDVPYQILHDAFGWQEAMQIPSEGIDELQITYDADLNNTDTSGHTSYYLDEEYGVAEWLSFLYSPLAPHASEDTQSEYGRNKNQHRIRFNLPETWQEICALPREGDYYTWSHNRPDPAFPGTIGFFHEFTRYTRRIGGVDVIVVFHDRYSNEAQSRMSDDVFTIFNYATREIGDLAENLSFPTQKYIVMFVPEINGVYPRNASHGAHGYFRGDVFDWDRDESDMLGLFGSITLEGFIGSPGAMRIERIHEGLITLLGRNGWVDSGRWTEAQKHESMVNGPFNSYSSIAGTVEDKPICDFGGDFPPGTSGYTVVYHKTELFWHLVNELMKGLTNNEKDVEQVTHYLYGYHARVIGGVRATCEDVLRAVNGISGFDFSSFFDHYAYGTTVLPLYVEDEQLKIDYSSLPEIPEYSPPSPPSGLVGELHQDYTITVRWLPSQEPRLGGYNVYRTYGNSFAGPEEIVFKRVNESLVEDNSFYDDGAEHADENYVYYVVTAVSTSGEESLYSNLASVPAPSKVYLPVVLRNY